MLQIVKDGSFTARNIPFGLLEVRYPARDVWREAAFRAFAADALEAQRARYPDYDRKAVFGDNEYVRFFKKFKKTYPVLLQFESFLRRDRPFPCVNPVTEVPFLLELCTFALSGTHDAERIEGPVTLYTATDKTPFPGLRGAPVHTYPNDVCGRDARGVILSMIAGADARTCARPESRHVLYPVFGTEATPPGRIEALLALLQQYVAVLAPDAQTEARVL